MDTLVQDLRYGVRVLAKARGFSALAVVTLAVGIAATTGVFSIVNTVLLKPLPFADPGRLFMLYRENPKRGAGQGPFSYSAYQTVARHARSLSGVAAVAYEPFTLTRLERPEEVPGARVSSSFFSVLGIQARAGRVFDAVVALLMASAGLYGVIAYTVAQRTREIGVRIALGAPRASVLRLVAGETARVAGIGIGIGIAAAAVAGRALGGFLYGVSPADPVTYVAMTALFGLVAVAAALVPARRAMMVDPLVALRAE